MSTPFVSGSDTSVLGASAVAGTGAGGAGGLDAGGTVLAFTGMGPGTALLGIAGFVSLLAGGLAVLTGKKRETRNDPTSPLRDLGHLA